MLLGGGGTMVEVTDAVDWLGGMLDEDDVVTVGLVGTFSSPELSSLPHPTAARTSPAASTRTMATRGAGRDTVDLRRAGRVSGAVPGTAEARTPRAARRCDGA
jgi:hypothetical protein